jgi:hypothetical protein
MKLKLAIEFETSLDQRRSLRCREAVAELELPESLVERAAIVRAFFVELEVPVDARFGEKVGQTQRFEFRLFPVP